MFNKFIEECYEEAIDLKKKFTITEDKQWTALTVTNEIMVQLGHYSYIILNNEDVEEKGRVINNPKDELADILLQLCALCNKINLLKEKLKQYNLEIKSIQDAILMLTVLFGQITECIMENEGYRFNKERAEYESKESFITERINKCFTIVFWIAKFNEYDMIKEFKVMRQDALNFLKKYEENKNV